MPTAHDVAAYIRSRVPGVQGFRLQKLLYYSQAWALAWDGYPLFDDFFEAWTQGPVNVNVYRDEKHAPIFAGNIDSLSDLQRETIDAVLDAYGGKAGTWLSKLTHLERPWMEARQGLPADAKSVVALSNETMRSFYSAQDPDGGPRRFTPAYLRGLELMVELPEDELSAMRMDQAVPGEAYLSWLEAGDD